MTAQANRDVPPRPHQQVTTISSHLTDFTMMNPSIFYGSKVDEDPQKFLIEVYKVLCSMRVSSSEKAKLASYQLKDMDQTWYVQWMDNRSLWGGSMTWEIFKAYFLDLLFPREMREEKVTEFIDLRYGGKTVHEYSLEFIKLSKYALSLVYDPRDQMSHFVMGVLEEYKRSANRPCYMTTRTFPILWFMQEGLSRKDLSEKVEMLRGQGHLMKVPQRIRLRYKTSQI
ncbi:uncharacterized protein [Solanum lycopersicum]|uniref:uncharacterized protein n=1 Tax=Solanum lycopersicum TaxID=4081 RepID=UPI003749D1C1